MTILKDSHLPLMNKQRTNCFYEIKCPIKVKFRVTSLSLGNTEANENKHTKINSDPFSAYIILFSIMVIRKDRQLPC